MKKLFVFLIVFFAGCATGPIYQTPSPPPDGYATLIIYREGRGAGSAWAVDVYVNSNKEAVASLREEGYTVIRLRAVPEKHAIRAGTGTVYIKAVSGETYYLKYGTSLGSIFFIGGSPIVQHKSNFNEVSSSQGLKEIVEYKLQPAMIQTIDDSH